MKSFVLSLIGLLLFAAPAYAFRGGYNPCPLNSGVVDGCNNTSTLTGVISDGTGTTSGNVFSVTNLHGSIVGLGQRLDYTTGWLGKSYTFIVAPVPIDTAITTSTSGAGTAFTVVNGANLQPGMLVMSANVTDGTTVSSVTGNSGVLSQPATATGTDTTSRFIPIGSLGSYYLSESNLQSGDFVATTQPPKLPAVPTIVGTLPVPAVVPLTTTSTTSASFTIGSNNGLYAGMTINSSLLTPGTSIASLSGTSGTLSANPINTGTDAAAIFLPPANATGAYATPATLQFPSYYTDQCGYSTAAYQHYVTNFNWTTTNSFTATTVPGSNVLTNVSITNGSPVVGQVVYGSGIPSGDTISSAAGSTVTLSSTVPGNVGTATVTAGGSGFTTATVSFSGGGGSGAAGTAVISGGVVQSITITNHGVSTYTSPPTVTITGDGTGATATAVLGGGASGVSMVVGLNVTVTGFSGFPVTGDPITGTAFFVNGGLWRFSAQVSGDPITGAFGGNGIYTLDTYLGAFSNTAEVGLAQDQFVLNPAPIGCGNQTGQPSLLAHRPPYNQPGIDYPVGINWDELYADTGSRSLRDPATLTTGNCVYHGSPNFYIGCGTSTGTDTVLEGYDLSMHGGVSVIMGGGAGRFIFKNNYFYFGCNSNNFQSGSNCFNGQQMVKFQTANTGGGCYFLNNVFNGNPSSWRTGNGVNLINITISSTATCSTSSTANAIPNGGIVRAYNAFLWAPARSMSGSVTGTYSFFNYFASLMNPYSGTHGEIDSVGSYVGQLYLPPYIWAHNTITTTATDSGVSAGGNNAVILPLLLAASGGWTAFVDDGSAGPTTYSGIAGDVMHVTTLSGQIYFGTAINNSNATSVTGNGQQIDPLGTSAMCGPSPCTGTGTSTGTYHVIYHGSPFVALPSTASFYGNSSGVQADNFYMIGNSFVTNRRSGLSSGMPGVPSGAFSNDLISVQESYLPHVVIRDNYFAPADTPSNQTITYRSHSYVPPGGKSIFNNYNLYDGTPCNTLNGACSGTYPTYPTTPQ